MTLRDLESALKTSGDAKKLVEFFDADGHRLAYSSKIYQVL
jgi:hypothetical protein